MKKEPLTVRMQGKYEAGYLTGGLWMMWSLKVKRWKTPLNVTELQDSDRLDY